MDDEWKFLYNVTSIDLRKDWIAPPNKDEGKGRVPKKKRISYGLFTDKKIYTHFFLDIESMIAKTNFTLGPIEKFIFFVKL